MTRLAEFMGVDASDELVQTVVQQTSHRAMLQHHAVFANRAQAANMHRAQGIEYDERGVVGKVRSGGV